MKTLIHKRLKNLTTAIIFVVCVSFSHYLYAINGKVTNNLGENVSGATVTFVNAEDSSLVYSTVTDATGFYELSLPMVQTGSIKGIVLFNNYPNPVVSGTVIPFQIDAEGHVRVSIFNLLGKEVACLHDGTLNAGLHQIVWNGMLKGGGRVAEGVYFYTVFYNGFMEARKMYCFQADGMNALPVPVLGAVNAEGLQEVLYNIRVTAIGHHAISLQQVSLNGLSEKNFVLRKNSPVPFARVGNYIGIESSPGVYDPIFVNGVNLGVSVPGTNPGQMAATALQYRNWFNKMGEMGFNAIRVYTLHYPRFYEELAFYNHQHPDKPIYVFHGVWLDEDLPAGNFYTFTQEFKNDIEEVVDCIYGNRTIAERPGRAWGVYQTDISPWIMAFIIGREVFPDEVELTNSVNASQTVFSGQALSIQQASPTAVWFTNCLDHLIVYERTTYGSERPVSQSSWPTLDPLSHPTEQYGSTEDDEEVNLANLNVNLAPAGYFASYHAYPYFPDFISEQPNYQTYSDNDGPNSYLGYLTDLKSHYGNFPLIVAEYGVPNSWGNAHFAHSGMNHGGKDEEGQGYDNVRLMKNIYQSGCGGAFVFGWIDEWFKQCWYTNQIGSTIARRPLWHNVVNPEQNFGLIAFDEAAPDYNQWTATQASCFVSSLNADYSNAYFHLKLNLLNTFTQTDTLWVAFDTYRSDWGESLLPNGVQLNNRAEFALRLTADSAHLFVTEAYNIFGIYHEESGVEQKYRSVPSDGAPWIPVKWKNNHWPDAIDDIGNMKVRKQGQPATSRDAVVFSGNTIEIKIPWSLLHFTDPSLLEVMHDNRNTSQRETYTSDGIAVTLSKDACFVQSQRYVWPEWNEAPTVTEREKASFQIVRQALQTIDFTPF